MLPTPDPAEAAFLRAIEANPADDTTRLVYADWLDERGDPRGEYLRAFVLTRRESPRCRKPAVLQMGRRMKALERTCKSLKKTWLRRDIGYHWQMPSALYSLIYDFELNQTDLPPSQAAHEAVGGMGDANLLELYRQAVALLQQVEGGELPVRISGHLTWSRADAMMSLSELIAGLESAFPHLLSSSDAAATRTAVSPKSASSVSAVNVSLQSSE